MTAIPAPSLILPREEWPDADFDLPDGQPIHSKADNDADEDWDLEMDLGPTGSAASKPQPFTIRSPITQLDSIDGDDDDDDGVSTIKVAELPKPFTAPQPAPADDDFEDAFALPTDLTQLSLAPLTLSHRASKNSLDGWGDKDQTSSSQSSDAYSTLGLADASPSSNSATSASLPDSETDDEDEEDDMDGLVIPTGLFDTGKGTTQLKKLLEMKQKIPFSDDRIKVASPNEDDDFEKDLVIDDSADLSPSRLLSNTQQHRNQNKLFARSNSLPLQSSGSSTARPLSRLQKSDRTKSPVNPPPSTRQLQKIRLSPSPPLQPQSRTQTFGALSPGPSTLNVGFSKSNSLRGQKSHTGLKPPMSPSTARQLSRKASLSSLMDSNATPSGSGPSSGASSSKASRYEEPTAASRARHKASSSRLSSREYKVPPTRPSTPSASAAAVRLTMPTQSSVAKSRPALASVFGITGTQARGNSPLPRPPSSQRISRPTPQPTAPQILRRPKRQRTYGDGTELDGIEDLPTDRAKESQFRVQPKGYGNRIPGGTYSSSKPNEKGTIRKKTRRESQNSGPDISVFAASAKKRVESGSKTSSKKRKSSGASGQTKRKPTLIKNLGGAGAPKVVGNMKWNPQTLRWEGNEQILRDFDAAVGTSTRPALITHLTGSSIGSPASSFASGARIVGNMIFDPTRMCWISTLPPDEEEPDVFANLADDENDDESWERNGGTLRAKVQPSVSNNTVCRSANSSTSSSFIKHSARSRAASEAGSERGSRASLAFDIDQSFVDACRAAEARHRTEMKGWTSRPENVRDLEKTNLYEIRAIASRNYED